MRAEIAALPAPRSAMPRVRGRLNLLVVGGSLGAQALNEAVPRALALLAPEARPRVMHQSGAAQIDALRATYAIAGVEAELIAFIDDMAARYAEADLVICRAGALTVAELAAAGVASVLVPFPHAVDDHQTGNARFLAEAGAAILLPQSDSRRATGRTAARLDPRETCRHGGEGARAGKAGRDARRGGGLHGGGGMKRQPL